LAEEAIFPDIEHVNKLKKAFPHSDTENRLVIAMGSGDHQPRNWLLVDWRNMLEAIRDQYPTSGLNEVSAQHVFNPEGLLLRDV